MKAVLVNHATHDLYIGNAPDPVPGDDDLLVSVKATALNRADLLQRAGKYPPPPGSSSILGLEMAGVVEQVGKRVAGWNIGNRVCALLPGGGYAQKVVIPARMAIAVPERLSFAEAAAIPEAFLTAWSNLFFLGGLAVGDHVLIHAAASGVGTAAIQLAREAGAFPIATAGSQAKLDICLGLGAQVAINYKLDRFADKVLETTKRRGVQVILDPVGASYWEQNAECIGNDGRWIIIGSLGGSHIEPFQLSTYMRKRVQLLFSTLRSRSEQTKISFTEQFVSQYAEKFADGKLVAVIDRVFDWTEAMEAHDHMAQNKNIGKIVLTVGD